MGNSKLADEQKHIQTLETIARFHFVFYLRSDLFCHLCLLHNAYFLLVITETEEIDLSPNSVCQWPCVYLLDEYFCFSLFVDIDAVRGNDSKVAVAMCIACMLVTVLECGFHC
jgi:hypothetical protein